MRMVPEWRQSWRLLSVQALALLAALPLAWAELPPDIKDMIPAEWRPWIVSVLAVAGIAGRLIRQPSVKP